MFSTHLENFLPFSSNLILSSANSFSLKLYIKFVIWERIKWIVLYTAFNIISAISGRQLTLFTFPEFPDYWAWALNRLAQGHNYKKLKRIQCGSNPGPLDYKSNTLPLSHQGPQHGFGIDYTEQICRMTKQMTDDFCPWKGRIQWEKRINSGYHNFPLSAPRLPIRSPETDCPNQSNNYP